MVYKKETTVRGYWDEEDLKNGKWNFVIDKNADVRAGSGLVNGDLLLAAFTRYIDDARISLFRWLNPFSSHPLATEKWDLGQLDSFEYTLFYVRGSLFSAHHFGNIEVGYIGAHFRAMQATRIGSMYVHFQDHGLNDWFDELFSDQGLMGYGMMLYLQDFVIDPLYYDAYPAQDQTAYQGYL